MVDIIGLLNQNEKTKKLTDSVKLDMEYKMEISIDDEEIINLDIECFSIQKVYDLQILATSGNTALVTFKTSESGVIEFDFIARDSLGFFLTTTLLFTLCIMHT